MNHYILQFKMWYESRPLREQVLVIALALAIMFAIFNLALLRPLGVETLRLTANIQQAEEQLHSWDTQLAALKKIAATPLYQEWLKQQQSLHSDKNEFNVSQWMSIIKALLTAQPNLTLIQIKNPPEKIYQPGKAAAATATSAATPSIYQQQFQITLSGDYFNTVNYIKKLEETLPYLHWDSLTYHVTQYPNANIDMEFSLVYEKNS